jgi:hypothetical protein
MIVLCDNAYQVLLAGAMARAGSFDGPVSLLATLGTSALHKLGHEIAADIGARHVAVRLPASPIGQLAALARLRLAPPTALIGALRRTQKMFIFNDEHPAVALMARHCPNAHIVLIEEGVGALRTRHCYPARVEGWARRMRLVPHLRVGGRHGEAPWVDELWLSTSEGLSHAQRTKRFRLIDIATILSLARHQWGRAAGLPPGRKPLLIYLGQPLVEDGALATRRLAAIQESLGQTLARVPVARLDRVYKAHPRERRAREAAQRLFGDPACLVQGSLPLELIDFEDRCVIGIGLSSGGLRSLALLGHAALCLAPCFPDTVEQIGRREAFAEVRFIESIDDLGPVIDGLLADS